MITVNCNHYNLNLDIYLHVSVLRMQFLHQFNRDILAAVYDLIYKTIIVLDIIFICA